MVGKGGGAERAVLLISGGPDSAVLAYWAKEQGYDLVAVHFKSGLKTDKSEMRAAQEVARSLGMPLDVFDISQMLGLLGNPRPMIHSEVAALKFGTAMCLSPAVAYASLIGSKKVYVALHEEDAREGPEYRRDFLDLFEASARVVLGKEEITIETPFVSMSKADLLRIGVRLGVDFRKTWSCINAEKRHCGLCGACKARQRGFRNAGLKDPTIYTDRSFLLLAAE
jgi:7-cyano-7-deazaguanine synthase